MAARKAGITYSLRKALACLLLAVPLISHTPYGEKMKAQHRIVLTKAAAAQSAPKKHQDFHLYAYQITSTTNRPIFCVHYIANTPSYATNDLEKNMYIPYARIKNDLEYLINHGGELKRGKIELSMDDAYIFRDVDRFVSLAEYFSTNYPNKCDANAFSLNITRWSYKTDIKRRLERFMAIGGKINDHTYAHKKAINIPIAEMTDDFSKGLEEMDRQFPGKIKLEQVSSNRYYAYIEEKSKNYIDATVPYGALNQYRINILRKQGVSFRGIKVIFHEVQLIQGKYENNNDADGTARIELLNNLIITNRCKMQTHNKEIITSPYHRIDSKS